MPTSKTTAKTSDTTEKRKVETVEERREKVLARGRKFKYPLQHAKYKVMTATIIIALLAVAGLTAIGWALLYKTQDTGDIAYRITSILPLPVAKVDEQDVRYSDYLMLYRSSLATIEQQSGQLDNSSESDALRLEYKRSALDSAEEYAYAEKLAAELGLTVSDEEVQASLKSHLTVGGIEQTEDSFFKIISDNLNLSRSEYEHLLYLNLLKAKVSEEIDSTAQNLAAQVEKLLAEKDLTAIAEELGNQVEYEETGELVDNKNLDGGRSSAANDLEPGATSAKFLSSTGDGYYFVKLIAKTDDQVNYISLKIPFTTFDEQFQELRDNNLINEYIVL